MTRFDGVVLVGLDASTDGHRRQRQVAEVRRRAAGGTVRLPDGSLARVTLPIGLPATLPCDPGADNVEVVVLGLEDPTVRDGRAGRAMRGRDPRGSHPSGDGSPAISDLVAATDSEVALRATDERSAVAVLPPVQVRDLLAVEPLPDGRVHAARWGEATVTCGRLPVQGPPRSPMAVDCERCLARGTLAERIAAQRAAFPPLVALAGVLTAAAAARWWWRTPYLDPSQAPALLDSAVGAVVHELPGAPDPAALLDRLADHAEQLSDPARAWAVTRAQRRAGVGDASGAHLLARLLPPPDAGELLLDVLAARGSDRATEALLWDIAVRAGPEGSPRLQRWRRIQAVAAALTS